jgi:PncC family amidohydrolase
MTIAVAESCTGGLIGAAITDAAGSSAYFKGGVIAYADEIKQRILHVPAEILARHGAVSAGTVEYMAQGITDLFKTDCGIAVSGIAGPEGYSEEKPVGLVFVGIVAPKVPHGISYRHCFAGDRVEIRNLTVIAALKHAIQLLTD